MQQEKPSPRWVTLAATQLSCSSDISYNLAKAEATIRRAAAEGGQIILLQELFASPYFPITQSASFDLAITPSSPAPSYLNRFSALARELAVVLPISFFESSGPVHFNSVIVYDADGSSLGIYRKSHIPDSPGYHEKWHFSPGDTGFRVFTTRYAKLGIAICWDQWFPEAARTMALAGAEVLLYPTAIGSEPQDAGLDSAGHWRRCVQGHAAANLMPVVVSNRIGSEGVEEGEQGKRKIDFYGGSFIADGTGKLVAEAGVMEQAQEDVVLWECDLEEIRKARLSWGVFRDRRYVGAAHFSRARKLFLRRRMLAAPSFLAFGCIGNGGDGCLNVCNLVL